MGSKIVKLSCPLPGTRILGLLTPDLWAQVSAHYRYFIRSRQSKQCHFYWITKMHDLEFLQAFSFYAGLGSVIKVLDSSNSSAELTLKPCETAEWPHTRWAPLCHAARAGLITLRRPKARFTVNYWTGALCPLTVMLAIGAWNKSLDQMVCVLQSRIP